jgi:hypothetical protein
MTGRTVRSLMLALLAMVAADGKQPGAVVAEHASASARRTKREEDQALVAGDR